MNTRTLLIGLFSFTFIFFVSAQDADTSRSLGPWGLSAGVFPHGSTISSSPIDYDWDINMSFSGGVCIPVSDKWAITGDAILLHTSAVFTRPPVPENELIRDEDIRDRFAYIHLSFGGRYYLSPRFYVGAYTGPALHIYTERLTIKNYANGFEQEERRRIPFDEGDVRRLNWFASFGIGYEMQLGEFLGLSFEPTLYTHFVSLDKKSDLNARALGVGLRTNIVFKDFNHNVRMRKIPEERRARYLNQKRKAEREAQKKTLIPGNR